MGLLQLTLANNLATTGSEIKQLEKERTNLVEQNKRLEEQIIKISSLSHIEKEAKSRFVMIPAMKHTLYLEEDKLASLR